MKTIAWLVLIICVVGCPFMVIIFLTTGNPMALLNTVWAFGLIYWCSYIITQAD